jgi:hypothetical protein
VAIKRSWDAWVPAIASVRRLLSMDGVCPM